MSDTRAASAVDGYIGARVRRLRLAANVSQEALAERLGLTFQQVQKYEKGVNRIAAARLIDIARALGQPVALFLPPQDEPGGGLDAAAAAMALEQALASAPGQRLLSAFLALPEAARGAAASAVENIVLALGSRAP